MLVNILKKYFDWGARKEYATILSIIVAILIPIFGFPFVMNQAQIKEIGHGKINGLMLFAIFVGMLYVLAGILLFYML